MTDAILSVEAVSKNFGGLAVIDDLTFSVRRGSRTALIGPNGAGKTTVFNLITGAYALDQGRIVMDGHDISHVRSRKRVHFGIARNLHCSRDAIFVRRETTLLPPLALSAFELRPLQRADPLEAYPRNGMERAHGFLLRHLTPKR